MNYLKTKKFAIIIWLFIVSILNISIFMLSKNILNNISDIFILLVNATTITILSYFLLKLIWDYIKNKNIKFIDNNVYDAVYEKKYCIIVWLIQIICWAPIFLAFYPGAFFYDVIYQIPQNYGSYLTHHPLIHTLYLKLFYNIIGENVLHNYNLAMAFSTLLQMLIFSAMLTYVHLFLLRMKIKKIIRYIVIAFMCIHPLISYMSISSTKDVLFSGFLCMVLTYLAYYIKLPKFITKKNNIIYIISIVGMIMFRNNGIFPIIALIMTLVFFTLKLKRFSKLFKLTLLGFILGVICFMSLKWGLKAWPGSMREAISIPIQQIACTYVDNEKNLLDDEKKSIKEFLPNVSNYCPYLADSVKNTKGFTKNDIKNFMLLYCKLLPKYPISYIKAFLQLTAGYLSITDETYLHIYNNDQNGYLQLFTETLNIKAETYLLFIKNLYIDLFIKNNFRNYFILYILLQPAIYFYIIMSAMYYILISKKFEMIPLISFLFVFLLTMLAGPCCLSRYFLSYFICIPTMIAIAITSD